MPRKKKTAPAQVEETPSITIYGDIAQITDEALLVDCNDESIWLPLSQISFSGEKGDTDVPITLPEWLAEERGLSDGDGRPAPDAEQGQEYELLRDCGNCGNLPSEWEARSEDRVLSIVCPECHERDLVSLICEHCGADMPTMPDVCGTCRHMPGASDGEDNWKPRRRAFGENVTWCKEDAIIVAQPLCEEEKLEYGQEMADALARIEEYEDALDGERKFYKRKIEEQEKIAQNAAKLYREGKEEREVFCDLLKDWNTLEMVWVEAEPPYHEVQRRPMTEEEKRPSLLDMPGKPQNPAEVAQAVEAAETFEGQESQTDKVQ